MDPGKLFELNGGDDEDEALRQAIALSMGQEPTPAAVGSAAAAAIDLTKSSDDDVDDDETASESSQTPAEAAAVPVPAGSSDAAADTAAPTSRAAATTLSSSSASWSIFGMDRKKMEEERLARLQKRKAAELDAGDSASASAAAEDRPRQRAKVSTEDAHQQPPRPAGIVPPYLRQAIDAYRSAVSIDSGPRPRPGTSASASAASGKAPASSSLPSPSSSAPSIGAGRRGSSLPFAKGVVKRTWLRGGPRTGDDIKIDEILQKDSLELAVLSSFVWDTEWLWTKVDPTRTRVTLIAFAGNDAEKAAVVESAKGVARLCFPPMSGMGCMHSKLQLLKFPGYLRVVVPSGNLVSYDWGETGVMENVVFIIDLPLLGSDASATAGELTPFGEELCYFLTAQGLDQALVRSLRKYDFSATSEYAFVHTIAGGHSNDSWQRTGYCGLGRAVRNLGLAVESPLQVDFVASSMGSLNYGILTALYNACSGDSGMKEYESRTAKPKSKTGSGSGSSSRKDGGSSADQAASAGVRDRFRVYFPSQETVAASRGGERSGGTICLQSRWWNAPTFPREVFRDLKNPRGVLVHSKILFVRPEEDPEVAAWAYVGSANLSESAWGRLVKDRVGSKVKMSCRNWECGVIVPTRPQPQPVVGGASDGSKGIKSDDAPGKKKALVVSELGDVFRGRVPLPMELPGAKYVSADGRGLMQPWFFAQ